MIDDERAKESSHKFEFDNSPFENLSSLPQQIEALKDNCGYIYAREEPLGYRFDNIFDSESGTYIQRRVDETYQYIPIIDVLTTVLSNGEVREAILSEEPSEEGVLASFIHGEWFKSHQFFQLHKYALILILYCDDFEIVGGFWSKTGPHKLKVFYFIIDNIPEHLKSKLGGIHVLCLCCSTDVKKYDFHHILERFMEDLQRLESDDGVLIKIEGQDFTLRASIAAFCGDGLAVHEVFGLLGPSATRFCRLCLITRENLLEGNVKPSKERTERVFSDHLQTVRTTGPTDLAIRNAETLTGLWGECPLNASKYYHIARNKIFDIMHDVLLGTGPMCFKLVLNNFIFVRRLFSVDYLNGQISAFQYGLMERKNKPSSNFTTVNLRNIEDNSLSQKAMQMWCLLRGFPFLVAWKIPKEDKHMNLILLFLRIMEIIFAPKLTKSIISYLKALIMEFFNHFKELFPNRNLINKFHHMAHYPDCITWSGPLVKLWCMGFERKHGPMKQRAQIANNFKNSPKTLIRICQSVQSAMWGAGDLKVYSVKSQDNDIVFKTKSIRVNGVKYSIASFVCLDAEQQSDINLPLFGKISYLRTMTYTTKHLDVDLNAFCIQCEDENNSDVKFLSTEELAHY